PNHPPPLLNSASPWCTTLSHLRALYASPHTGAITTRTALLGAAAPFPHDDAVHQFTFFNPGSHDALAANPAGGTEDDSKTGSLNTLGYSPIGLDEYLAFVEAISRELAEEKDDDDEDDDKTRKPPRNNNNNNKPIILSVAGPPSSVLSAYHLISTLQPQVHMPLALEINLSCPNIADAPPPAYSAAALGSYFAALQRGRSEQEDEEEEEKEEDKRYAVPIGIKTPPYTYQDQFQQLVDALLEAAETGPETCCPIDFITATNTLGCSLLLTPSTPLSPSLSPSTAPTPSPPTFHPTLHSATNTGLGGLAGTPLHPLALGNVYTIKTLLLQHQQLAHIQIIGVGGVEDAAGYRRMRAVGAAAVGVGTALGRKGVGVFGEII
ncbi:hypothetical protein BDV95DRAFT_440691, partial [Massariosphaeria phaeospora]